MVESLKMVRGGSRTATCTHHNSVFSTMYITTKKYALATTKLTTKLKKISIEESIIWYEYRSETLLVTFFSSIVFNGVVMLGHPELSHCQNYEIDGSEQDITKKFN